MIDRLYGWKDLASIEQAETLVADMLGISFEKRESSYLGEYLRWANGKTSEITIQYNISDEDGNRLEEDFSDYPVLLYVEGVASTTCDAIMRISGIQHLSTEDY